MITFTVHVERHMHVPAESVWELIDDFGAHHRFNPLIEHSRITNELPTGEGAEREVHLYDGSLMRQRIVDYQPMRSMVIEVIDESPVLHHHLIEISVNPRSRSSCVLAYKVTFYSPLGPLGWPAGLLHKLILRSRYGHVLRGIKQYVQRSGSNGE